jgi:iron complex outermembrane receptor protein
MRLFNTGLVFTCGAMVGFSGIDNAAAASETGSGVLEEIVVTAQKREQNLKDVPISVVVVSGESLSKQNLKGLGDLTAQIPNIYVARGTITDTLYIRGAGSGNNIGFEQSVATFVDGVYHGRSRYSRGTFVDLERLEVLRGPQSTFFGNNAIAGAFSVTTRRPGKEWEVDALGSYEFEAREFVTEVGAGGPLTDTLGLRVVGSYSDMDGWIQNLSTNERNPQDTNKFGRATLVWEPAEDWEVTLRGEYGNDESTAPTPTQVIGCPAPAPFPLSGLCAAVLATGTEAEFDDKRSSTPGEAGKIDNNEYMLNVERKGDGLGFVGQLAYSKYHSQFSGQPSSIPVPFFQYITEEHYDQTTLELRLTSPNDSKLQYMVGAFGMRNELKGDADIVLSFLTPVIQFLETLPPAFGGLPPGVLSSFTPLQANPGLDQQEDAYSVFGSMTWPFTDKLSGTIGARWTRSEKDGTSFSTNKTATTLYGAGGIEIPDPLQGLAGAFTGFTKHYYDAQQNGDDILPSANLQYQWTDDLSAYISYSEGFKAGGFDASEASGDPARLRYGPESVKAYEIGLKGLWLDRTLSANLAVFYDEYDNLQNSVTQITPTSTFVKVTNVGRLPSRGVELDVDWQINEVWRLGVNVATLDAEYKDYQNAACTALQLLGTPKGATCVQDLSGEAPAFSPDYSGSARLGFELPVGGGSLRITGDTVLSFSDDYDLLGTNDPNAFQSGWEKIDLRLGLGSEDGKWEVALLGKNLADKKTSQTRNPGVFGLGSYATVMDRGRQMAIQVRVKL